MTTCDSTSSALAPSIGSASVGAGELGDGLYVGHGGAMSHCNGTSMAMEGSRSFVMNHEEAVGQVKQALLVLRGKGKIEENPQLIDGGGD